MQLPLLATAAAVAVLTLAGCTRAATPPAAGSGVVPCGQVRLDVRLGRDGLTARNGADAPCRLSGTRTVDVPWWQVEPGTLVAPNGVLHPGDTLVQGYRATATNGCPLPSAEGTTQVSVDVEGRAYAVTMPAHDAYVLMVCTRVAAEPPRIVP